MKKNVTLIPINVKIRKLELAKKYLPKMYEGTHLNLEDQIYELVLQREEIRKKQNRQRVNRWRKQRRKT